MMVEPEAAGLERRAAVSGSATMPDVNQGDLRRRSTRLARLRDYSLWAVG